MQANYIAMHKQTFPSLLRHPLSLLIYPTGSKGFPPVRSSRSPSRCFPGLECCCCPQSPSCALVLQGTLQKFLDDLFKAILSIRDDKPPVAVKYFFDFLEEQAEKRGITDPDTMHIWKTNRFGRGNLFFLSFLPSLRSSSCKALVSWTNH